MLYPSMERLKDLVEEFKDVLWGSGISASTTEFESLLEDIRHHASARMIAFKNLNRKKKELNQPLTDADVKSAIPFLKWVSDPKNDGKKRSYFQGLNNGALAVSAVLFQVRDLKDHDPRTSKAISEGALLIAKWSPWPKDPKFPQLLQKYCNSKFLRYDLPRGADKDSTFQGGLPTT